MKYTMHVNEIGVTTHSLEITSDEMKSASLTAADLALLHECNRSKEVSVMLMGLSCLAGAVERTALINALSAGGKEVVTA